ncbi:MAG: CapA family protein [candidate division WOR-3 bacterium]
MFNWRFLLLLFSFPLLPRSISIIATGDIMMGSDYPYRKLPPENGKDLFKNVDSILKKGDITLGNLEGPLLKGGTCKKKIERGKVYAFRTPPEWAENLALSGFDFLNLANNHMNDFGYTGIQETIKALNSFGLQYGGPYGKVGNFNVKDLKIAIICFSTSPNSNSIFDIKKAQKIVAEYSRTNDIVVVSFHGGGEGTKFLHTYDTFEYFMGSPRGNVVKFARAVVDSGADFVWGHGPHVPRAIEIYKERLIAYSLGNFCTWGFNVVGELGYAPILKVELDSVGAFKKGKIYSAVQKPYNYPKLDSSFKAAKLIRKLSEEDFPESCPTILEDGEIYPRMERR